ncbi:hypothetical protein AALO_G00095260 [Alosa alosa]|uniref:Uncharacterized protein n=1 Tax=Alosa alosa TaxID=278164 RepID=A0AAV6GXJ7_9TELE|nr:hypothetical protein AALO_G00095260 [Alosa alosa]
MRNEKNLKGNKTKERMMVQKDEEEQGLEREREKNKKGERKEESGERGKRGEREKTKKEGGRWRRMEKH